VTITAAKIASARPTVWARARIQLGVGLLLAVLVPWAARVQIERTELELAALQNSLAGSLLAVVLGFYSFRRLSRYPGVRSPTTSAELSRPSFGIVLAIFFFAVWIIAASNSSPASCSRWSGIMSSTSITARAAADHRGGAFGQVQSLLDITDVNWIRCSLTIRLPTSCG
jgi:hypothetical protein